ncbi:MAG TPA: hypothetical protein VK721_01630 [Solirubrobacteraceae bacterium]|jgi:hypothetical protein|nr:hypothetical protein [Solirubrobacteraceae bacterium]
MQPARTEDPSISDAPEAAPRRPLTRLLSPTRRDVLLIVVPVALIALIYVIYALRVGNFQNDEEEYLTVARYVAAHFPSAIWLSSLFARGTQRLDPIILALPFALARGPGAFQLAHVIQCLLFVSTAVPCFLLARRAGLPRAASIFAAVLCIVVPWAVVATSYLAECLAYPVYAWVLYATWNTITKPSLGNDVLTVLALVVAVFSRTAMLALLPILPLAIIWQEWTWGLRGTALRRRPRALLVRVWSTHRLLSALVALGVLVLLLDGLGLLPGRGLATLTGDYTLPVLEPLLSLLDRYREYVSRMATGTGLIALALALPWLTATLVKPRDGACHALAVVCTLGLATILFSLLQAPGDERYVLYSAVPISLACAASLSQLARAGRLRAGVALGVLAGTAAVIAVTASAVWPAPANPYDYFSYPSAIFYERVVLGRASEVSVPLIHLSAGALLALALVIVMAAWALITWRVRDAARPAAVLLGVAVLALCGVQTAYALRKFTTGAGGGPSAAERSWVDAHVPSSARVGALAVGLGETPDYVPIWRSTEFWNTSVEQDVSFGPPGSLPFPPGSEPVHLKIQPGSGLLSAVGGPLTTTPITPPEWLLIPAQATNRIALAGQVVAHATYVPLELERLSKPARALWEITFTSPEGFLTSRQTAYATVFSGALAGLRRPCATFSLLAPPAFAGSWPYTVSSAGVPRRGSLRAAQTAVVTIPLHPGSAPHAASAKVAVTVDGQTTLFGGLVASAKLAFFKVASCSRS